MIDPGEAGKSSDFINDSERDATPANDAGRVPKLEDDAKLSMSFLHPAKYEIFTGDGTFTPDARAKFVEVEMWGAGGDGGYYNGSSSYICEDAGGGGGAYNKKRFLITDLTNTVEVIVGQGSGATSSFGTYLYAYGGGQGGRTGSNGTCIRAGGGGQLSAGGSAHASLSSNQISAGLPIAGVGDGGNSTGASRHGIWGGGAGGEGTDGGNSLYGGGGGGGSSNLGGLSVFGGNGGNGARNGIAQNGAIPGGGGGFGRGSTNSPASMGYGARGEVRITTFY
jgi:hypothetical protein